VEPEQVAAIRNAFDSAASAPQLRCEINATRPALNFSLRFQTGYVIDVPLVQFRGPGHGLRVFIRVTPEGLRPAYLVSTQNLPDVPASNVPATKVDGEMVGTFVVGEGAYDIEALVEDDLHRACHRQWRIQARRSGSERELRPATPPATVGEFSAKGPESRATLPEFKSTAGIGRLTLMIHAASLSPRSAKLHDDDIAMLVGSLSSLLEQLPARSVRLVVFNLDQQAVLFQQDGFAAKDLEKFISALNQLQLALVDYRTLQKRASPSGLLADLVQAELRGTKSPDALILLGPRSPMHDDIPPEALEKFPATIPGLFYLQYEPRLPLRAGLMPGPPGRNGGPASMGRDGPLRAGQSADGTFARGSLTAPGGPDSIEKLVARLKGKTIAVRTPHDFADAIRHILGGIVSTSVPGEAAAAKAPSMEPAVASPDKIPQENQLAGDEDPTEVLMRLRDYVLEHGERIPNHTCVETIERNRYEPTSGRLTKPCDALLARRQQSDSARRLRLDITDRLRLDVAMTMEREIYSWAGAGKFEEGEIDELVPEGAMGTGPFAAMLLSIFGPRNSRFVFEGDTTLDGRRLMDYSFRVPREQSHYRVKAQKEWVITGYTGRLLVDPQTAELVRLTVRTEELPPETTTCETDTTMEYGLVQLDGGDYLLPKATRQRFIGRDGSEAENSVAFSACRDYQAESKLTFGPGLEPAGTRGGARGTAWDLPTGLPVTVELVTTIHGDKAAAGDPIDGRLAKPIRDERQQKILVPEGAKAQGRLMRVEIRYSHPAEFTLALRWETLDVDGVKMPFSVLPNRRAAEPGRAGAGGLRRRGMEIELPLPGEGQYGVYHFSREGAVMESGFRTEWLTAKP
jgi:hypothetical protein